MKYLKYKKSSAYSRGKGNGILISGNPSAHSGDKGNWILYGKLLL